MNKQNLIIYKFKSLYEIFKELEINLNFKIIELTKEKHLNDKLNDFDNYLIITKAKIENTNNQLVISEFPIKISNFIEKLNIQFLKNQFNKKSELVIGKYKIDLNSRELKLKDVFLKFRKL